MSQNTIKKAQKIVDNKNIAQVEDELWQVKSSSDPTKSYMVTRDSCDCLGFKNYYKWHHGKGIKATCSHLEALGILIKLGESKN